MDPKRGKGEHPFLKNKGRGDPLWTKVNPPRGDFPFIVRKFEARLTLPLENEFGCSRKLFDPFCF
jgi:hypothetical protein